jgi:peptidoglycan L-alanyl-D-glutamate endopeptidase CwlK
MQYKYSMQSLQRIATCELELQTLFMAVGQNRDTTIVCGKRTKEAQHAAFMANTSQVDWPRSKHNVVDPLGLSRAIDAGPYSPAHRGVDWNDKDGFYYFGGYVMATAEALGIKIRWGGNWDGDMDLKDQNFFDLVHFELID